MITLNYQNQEGLSGAIAGYWHEWNSHRTNAMELWSEIDIYLLATDTSSLEGGDNFDHKTHLPILAELYEDLVAIVYSTIFPHDDWLDWQGYDLNAITVALRKKTLSYIKRCHSLSGFNKEMRKVIDDLVRYGNCFTQVYYKDETTTTEKGVQSGYAGPALRRIGPYDIVFNPVAKDFAKTPKIIRSLLSVGEAQDFINRIDPEHRIISEDQQKRLLERRTGDGNDYTERYKEEQYIPSGFGSIEQYYMSGFIEFLWFYGDIYDESTNTVHYNRCIVVVDRDTIVLDKEETHPNIFKGGWTDRPDNLWSQGPLDKVVGINYMINHRENGKNDAIDKFIYPDRAYVGDVEEIYDEVTGHTKYILPEGGSVTDITPDTTVLTFDNQIIMHRELARQSARLPQQLSGFRTAGEKTATEVQSLNDGAFRGFINKANQLEEDVLEPVVKAELMVASDNYASIIKVLGEDEEGILMVSDITQDDLNANGKLVPIGSRRFARQLQQMQGINMLANSNLAQLVGQHINTYNLARAVEELSGFDKFEFIQKFAVVDEQLEAEEKAQYAQQAAVDQASQPSPLEMELEDAENVQGS